MPGLCYHLFSQERFHHFQMYQDAEILRVPIHSICLQTKMLAPVNVSITDYLAKAPEPPSNVIIRGSLRMLKSISALGIMMHYFLTQELLINWKKSFL